MPQNLKLSLRGIKKYVFLFLSGTLILNTSHAQNAIVTENANAGTPSSVWDIPSGDEGDDGIQGFGMDISVNKGGSISFKIDVNTGTNKVFDITIYRIGYYQGNGARKIVDLGNITGVAQNACGYDPVTGLTDCGNWSVTASWTVPSTVVSGLYIAKLTRSAAGGGGTSHIPFVVRDDASTSALLVKTSDCTWQAYNPYGGNSLYVGAGLPNNHASKVSFNRPFFTRAGGGGGGAQEDWFMNAEYPMIRFLERNGYDVSYITDIDAARSGSLLLNHKVFLSVGHDEYWSKPERDNVEAARAAGKNLAFFSGNESYWKTRWENSTDGTSTPFRTLVCYKEGTLATSQENPCGGKCDVSSNVWTGLWRDGCGYAGVTDACKPENALSGEISWDGLTSTILVPATYKSLRFWRNTAVASLGIGQSATLTTGTLGYEWDWEQYFTSYPPGRITMSSTDFDGHTHKLSLYKSTAGGLVFGAGTVQWSWGLDATHDRGNAAVNASMQQATINLFADMGVQPATLQSGLVAASASTDVTPPVATISIPANNTTITSLAPVTISGTASDANTVAGVEISSDGGATWTPATGTTSWTYSWSPTANGTYTIKARGIDDSGNYTTTASSATITVIVSINTTFNCPCNLFGSTVPSVTAARDNTTGIVIGTKFRSSFNGTITGIRFFKASGNSGTHTGLLYDNTGVLLAQATFTAETATGWQQVSFSSPVSITGNKTYIAAYLSSSGYYSSTNNYFTQALVNGPLTGLADGTDGFNGVYAYSSSVAFPFNTYQQGNYWVDAVYNNTTTANAGANQTITLPTSTVTLNGTGSTGTITSYAWTLISGPNTPTFTTPAAVSTTVTGLIQGTYIFQLAINGGVSTSQVIITVNPTPPPVSNAGPKQTITLPTSSVTLNGSGSTGTITSYAWTWISGPNTPTITTPAAVTTTVTGLIQGTYIFQLSVNGGVSTAKDTVIVNPVPPPTANAGSNQTIVLPNNSASLSGSGSAGTITSYNWTQVSGPNTASITTPTTVATTVTGLIQGTYVFQLSVNAGVSTSQVSVTVSPAATTISIFTTQTPPTISENDGQALELGVKFRTNVAGFITGIRFYKTTGNTGTHTGELYSSTGTRLAQAVFTGETASGWQQVLFSSPVAVTSGTSYIASYFSASGNYTSSANYFTAAIVNGSVTALADGTDGNNGLYRYTAAPAVPNSSYQKSNYWVDVLFSSTPPPPVANAGLKQTITLPTSMVTLSGSASTGTITSYAWTLVSGPNAPTITSPSVVTTTVTGLIQGTYVFQLSLNGGASTAKDTVIVNPIPPPTANAGANQTIALPTSTVTLNGSASLGTITSYTWTMISGPNTPVITTPTLVSTTITGLVQGVYIFQLSLNGGVSLSQVTITVNPAPPPVANAGSSQTISVPASSVTLNGSGSTGVITSYAWTQVSGPNTAGITTPSAVTTTVTGLILGNYVFQLSVNGGISISQVGVNVLASANYTIFTTLSPAGATGNDGSAIEIGTKFRSSVAGTITGIRFYKTAGNTGTHTGELYSSTGTRLAQAVFTGETATGWQQVLFSSPVSILANTTYVACYFSSAGNYVSTANYFYAPLVNGPLTGLADGTDGNNGIYKYTTTPAFPNSSYKQSNYWVDPIFNGVFIQNDITPPTVILTNPANSSNFIHSKASINVFFSEPVDASSVNGNTVILQNGSTTIPSSVIYNAQDSSVTLTPSSPLNTGTLYTMTVKGGTGTNKIKDEAGNAMLKDSVWKFTTNVISNGLPTDGPGGPILLISSTTNPFSRYPVEILRAEGWNAFNALDISAVTTTEINKYDVVIVGDITLTAAQVSMLSAWVTAGGTLIAFHPDPQLNTLLGINSAGSTLTDEYLLINTATAPGLGIVNQTIQYHGPANLYTVNAGTNTIATLYSSATAATTNPAITSRNVGTLGGQAIAFAYDLARSIVYTRQGNPAWAGQKRDGNIAPIRSDDMYYGNASFDPEPDYVNLTKVSIPQADEQQRLLTNIILAGNFDRKPLPRFWFLPRGKKAAIVMTGDDHAHGGTPGRMNQYLTLSSSNTASAVANWDAIRSSSYMYPGTPITNAQIAAFQNQGFDLSAHVNPNCDVWTPSELNDFFDSQSANFFSDYYAAYPLTTHRIHCLSWSDWATLPKTELLKGIRLDVNYYYWPDVWITDRPGMFTGSGMPMRFADTDGTLIDCYQVTTQMTDESGQTYPKNIDSLLNKATGAEGYYGVFAANMHTDLVASAGSDAIIQSAQTHQVPVVSSKQMLDWIDGRNNSNFSNFTWTNSQLGFTVVQDPRALNLKGMLPKNVSVGNFLSLTLNGVPVTTTSDSIKGIKYIFFDALSGNYVASYSPTAPSDKNAQAIHITPTPDSAGIQLTNYLGQNYPNPFTQNTRINYSIAHSGQVELLLYDMQGRPVKMMVNVRKEAGNYMYDLNTENLARGVYFYRIRSGDFTAVKKLIIQ